MSCGISQYIAATSRDTSSVLFNWVCSSACAYTQLCAVAGLRWKARPHTQPGPIRYTRCRRRALNGPYHPSSFPHCMTVSQSWVPDGLCWKTYIQYITPNLWACCVQRWTRIDTAGFSRHDTGPSGGRRVLEGLQDSPGLLRQRVALPEPGCHLQHSRLHGLQQRSALHHLRGHGPCGLGSSAPKAGVIYFYFLSGLLLQPPTKPLLPEQMQRIRTRQVADLRRDGFHTLEGGRMLFWSLSTGRLHQSLPRHTQGGVIGSSGICTP